MASAEPPIFRVAPMFQVLNRVVGKQDAGRASVGSPRDPCQSPVVQERVTQMNENSMSILIRTRGGGTYSGRTYLEVVETMRRGDFGQSPTVRAYVQLATERAGWLGVRFGALDLDEPEDVLAEKFVKQAIAAGLAEKVMLS